MKRITLNKKQKIIIAVATVLICTAGGITYTVVKNKAQNEAMQNMSEIETYYIPDPEKIFIKGQLVPYNSKDFYISSEQGVLNRLNVEDGVIVDKDTLLYICENPQVIAEVEDLEYEIELKYREKNNVEDKDAKKGIDLEIANMQEKVNKLNEDIYSYVYAPFAGKVYLGEIDGKDSSTPIMTLESTSFYIDGAVNEYDLFKVNLEQEVEVLLYATKENITGKITYIGDRPYNSTSAKDGSSNSLTQYGVKIELENQESFRNGLHVQGVAEYVESKLRLPIDSILEEEGKQYVYRVENDIAHKTEVTVVDKTDEFAVIDSGIKQGDIVVRKVATVKIQDGQNIYATSNGSPSEGVVEGE